MFLYNYAYKGGDYNKILWLLTRFVDLEQVNNDALINNDLKFNFLEKF